MTQLVHVPFAKGQNEGADPKLLPTGLLREAVNVRFRADGRLGCRYGYESVGVDLLGGGSVTPQDLAAFNDQQLALAGGDRSLVRVETGASWKALDDGLAGARSLRVLGAVDVVSRAPLQNQSTAADVAVTSSGWACMVWCVPRVAGAFHASALVVRVSDGAVLALQRVGVVKSSESVRVVAVGTTIFVLGIENTSGDIEAWSLDTASASTFTSRGQLIDTLNVHSSFVFDARQNGTAEFVIAWRSGATTISWENFTAATLATQGSRQTVTANGKLSVDAVNGATIAVANITSTGTVEVRTWNEATQALIGSATVDSGTDNIGQPWVELNAAGSSAIVTTGATETGTNATHPAWRYRTVVAASLALGTLTTTVGARPASGAFYMPSGEPGVWLVDTDTIERGYVLTRFGGSRTAEPEGLVAKPFAATAALMTFRRGKVASLGSGAYLWATLVVNGDPSAATLDSVPVLYRFEVEQQERVPSARLGGDLYFAGGLITLFDGVRYYEQDFPFTPVFDELTPLTSTGALEPSSVYTYSAVLEFVDSQNQSIFSAPSTPRNVTMAAGNNTVRLEFHAPFLRKLDAAMGSTNVNLIVYRSKTDGTVLRELVRLKWTNGSTVLSYTDLIDDCDLDGKAIIYTQGNRGALSGLLQNDAPNGARYIWPGRDRLILGRRDGVQWSKRLFNGEGIAWSNQSGFFSSIAGVTAVASLDERWLIATKDAWYEVTGEGPDDAGNGEFLAPRRVPAEGGCIDSRCMVEVSGGLIYQQDPDRLFLMPRGGGAPIWFSQAVRSTLAAYPTITSGVYCRRDNTVVFTCNDLTGTSGVLVVHDLRSGDWYVDELDDLPPVRGASAWGGAHAICGSSFVRLQTQLFADVAATIGMRVLTGSVLPFGTNAWGWVYNVVLLGEWRSDCTVTLRISYDDGDTFTTLTAQSLLTAEYDEGDPVRLQWTPSRQKTSNVVLEWTIEATGSPGEALVLNAFTLEVEAADGAPRLRAEDRL